MSKFEHGIGTSFAKVFKRNGCAGRPSKISARRARPRPRMPRHVRVDDGDEDVRDEGGRRGERNTRLAKFFSESAQPRMYEADLLIKIHDINV